ncbi:rho GTPase-activating protein 6 [Elysia marginata]|uniref:Rho GTPase-activating protein 6 n=1 Tax=Elysia marginata TaxID=1093978 RepID=A0AAV4JZF7_9GAST|nr:rho GTPase-activating protein 6 [Elysia marginata]
MTKRIREREEEGGWKRKCQREMQAGSCTWSSVSGRKVTLRPVSILQLTESERLALQKIAHSKLQDMDLGCPVVIPKDTNDTRRSKKSSLSLKRRSKSVNASAIDSLGKDGAAPGLVFGIPLSKCVMNDREMEKKRRRVAAHSGTSGSEQVAGGASSPPSSSKLRGENSENIDPAQNSTRPARKSSSSSQGSLENSGGMTSYRHDSLAIPAQKRAVSSDSLSESESSRNTSSSLIDALTLSHQLAHPAFRPGSLSMDARELANQGLAQVPYVVKACFRHIETYGLNTLGIFRVGSSKKRVKQLREEFDSGHEVQLTEDHNPHDVGALLKEYYRDLPEPLLTRDLYVPFLCAKRLPEEHQRHDALRLLICMLPLANRDTLWSLLRFLAKVAQHAQDTIDEKGETVSGNKMDVHNLATLFGPNILRRSPAGGVASASDKELMYQQSGDRVEESKEVIEVVKDMIEHHHDLFELSGTLRDDVLRLLIESDQETADRVLKYLANQNQIDADPESMCSVFEDSTTNSPMLFHPSLRGAVGGSGVADKGSVVTTSHHRPLRVSRSADNSLDSPVSKSRATHLSDSQAMPGPGRDTRAAGLPHSHSLSYSPSQHSQHSIPHQHLEARLTPPSSLTPPLPATQSHNFEAGSNHHHRHHQPHHHHHQHHHSGFPNPLPELRVHPSDSPLSSIGSTAAAIAGATGAIVVLRGKPQTLQVGAASGLPSRPHSESFHSNLNIPRPLYMRENSAASSYGSSGSGDALSSSINSHLSSENTATNMSNRLTDTWGLPTPPTSRGSSPSPKAAFFSSASSSSTLIPASSSPHLNNNEGYEESHPPMGSAEWERERWKHWEKVAAEKSRKNAEAEQETLV